MIEIVEESDLTPEEQKQAAKLMSRVPHVTATSAVRDKDNLTAASNPSY